MKQGITFYKDGAVVRIKNKRISFIEDEESTILVFRFADENSHKPACHHLDIKGKVRHTELRLSNEAMELLVRSYTKHKLNKCKGIPLEVVKPNSEKIKETKFKITKETRWDDLMYNKVISCRLRNIMSANIEYDGYDPKVKDLYPISIKEFKGFRNAGKKTEQEFINLYKLLNIEILN